MKIDLENMSREELLDLRAKVDDAIASAAERERQAAIAAAEEAARQFGFSLNELGMTAGSGRRKARASGPKNPPRYRNPNDPSQTWSGRGRRPQWVKDAEGAGIPLAEMAI
jgi:DNA-binding protein H-NS